MSASMDSTHKIIIRADRTPPNNHERQFNAPTTSEVAVTITGHEGSDRDIVVQRRGGQLQRMSEIHPLHDPLQYPLIFWDGRDGYHIQIPHVNKETRRPDPNGRKVTCMEFYAYHLMSRVGQINPVLYYRDLINQFITDMYAKIETTRLKFIRNNQKKLRSEKYIHLHDAVRGDGLNANEVGTKVVLPSSFIGSARHMHQYAQDAMAYVRKYGRPCLFVTFTCNPKWPEIVEQLHDGLTEKDRSDKNARVFRLKKDKFVKLIQVIYGPSLCHLYMMEWQKRGLPHVHILLWLKEKIRPEQVDDIISAEIPDPVRDPLLYKTVTENMIHGPYGIENPTCPCMKDGLCTKRYPKQFVDATRTDQDGYPLHRRRSPAKGGQTFTKKIGKKVFVIDNRYVVPYSPLLSKIFNAHINIEFCHSVKAIKYICKYIYKGSDYATYEITTINPIPINPIPNNPVSNNPDHNNDDPNIARDEIHQNQLGRYINSNEAVWRILGFELHDRHPAVTHLAVHLENGERRYFTEETVESVLDNRPHTTLTAFFKLNQEDAFARTILYVDVPEYYTWGKNKMWARRKQGRRVENWPDVKRTHALGRVYSVHPSNEHCFYLRILLHHVYGPTSFESLRTVEGVLCASYEEACKRLGLLETENHLRELMDEAAETKSPSRIRELFAVVLTSYNPTTVKELWEAYKDSMTEDILFRLRREMQLPELDFNESMYNEALVLIEDKTLAIKGWHLKKFHFTVNRQEGQSDLSREVLREKNYNTSELLNFVQEKRPLLARSPEQLEVYTRLMENINNGEGGISFLDAPGGTGKTFLLNLILAEVRAKGDIALATASSGIAATLFDGGRTAHSTFNLPLNLAREERSVCNIPKQSGQATLLKKCNLIVWDECTVAHTKALEMLDATLRDLRDCDRPMGGVSVILAGDFRQTLPIVTRGTTADEIAACIKQSILWRQVSKYKLSLNMRALATGDPAVHEFSENLLKIGNGQIPHIDGKMRLPQGISNHDSSKEELIQKLYPNIQEKCQMDQPYYDWLCERAILAPRNDGVDELNMNILQKLSGDVVEYKSFDKTLDPEAAVNFPIEFLNSQNLPGIPQHQIKLKVGCPITLLRNIDSPRLCNGTQLCVTALKKNLIEAVILTGCAKGSIVFIPRIPINVEDIPFPFKRTQFPIRLAFAMTVNKSQGQSFKSVGIDVESPCFGHGQLYVACSRVGSGNSSYTYAPGESTRNVVYTQVLDP